MHTGQQTNKTSLKRYGIHCVSHYNDLLQHPLKRRFGKTYSFCLLAERCFVSTAQETRMTRFGMRWCCAEITNCDSEFKREIDHRVQLLSYYQMSAQTYKKLNLNPPPKSFEDNFRPLRGIPRVYWSEIMWSPLLLVNDKYKANRTSTCGWIRFITFIPWMFSGIVACLLPFAFIIELKLLQPYQSNVHIILVVITIAQLCSVFVALLPIPWALQIEHLGSYKQRWLTGVCE